MSRLKFKENYFSDESIMDESTDSEAEAGLDKSLLRTGKSPTNPIVLDEEDSVVVDEEVQATPSKKRKKNKKKKKKAKKDGVEDSATLSTSTGGGDDDARSGDQIEESAAVVEEPRVVVPTSSWLGAFLQKKRTLDIMPPPEIETSNDLYIRSFNEEFDNNQVEEDSDDEIPVGVTAEDPFASTDKIEELAAAEEEPSTNPKLNFFNLPYSITESELIDFGSKLGYTLINVKIGFDKKKNLPSGSASAEIAGENIDINACVSKLQNENCCGRPVRVTRSGGANDARRRLSGSKDSSRYFVNDITVKCQNCGEVGHKQFECSNEATPTPCHLCAGKDHEAVNCPNITCFRCGLFGHHSRDCKNDRSTRPVFCSQCGSTTHDVKNCRYTELVGGRLDSRVEGRFIKCISCNQFGHTMCQSLPKLANIKGVHADVYCPNCGEKGHHIEYPHSNENNSYCKAPKYEAFVKFPKLLENTDGKSGAEKNEYYRDVLRNASFTDRSLFPSLNQPSSSSGGGAGGSGSGNYQPVRNGITYNDGPTYHDRQSGGNYSNNTRQDRRDDYSRGGDRNQYSSGQKRKNRDYYSDDEYDEYDNGYDDRRPNKRHSRFGSLDGDNGGGSGGGGGRVVYQDNHRSQRYDNSSYTNNQRRQSHGGNYHANDGYGGKQQNSGGNNNQSQGRQRHSYSGGERIHNVKDTVKDEFDAKAALRKSRFG